MAIASAVAVAVVSANGSGQASDGPSSQLPATADIPSATATEPSFAPTSAPPPLDPKDFVSSAKKDGAPLSPDLLFPGTQLTMGDTVYKKGPTADTRTCGSAAQGTLPKVLDANDCTRLLRVTYTEGDTAVTVGVAVFDTEAQAAKAKKQADKKSIVRSLSGGGVKSFCTGAVCPLHHQLLRPLRLLHRRRLHERQERHGEVHGGVPGRRRPGRVRLPADPQARRGSGFGGGGGLIPATTAAPAAPPAVRAPWRCAASWRSSRCRPGGRRRPCRRWSVR